MKKLILILSLFFVPYAMAANTATISGTIADSGGTTWTYASWQAVLVGTVNAHYKDGTPVVTSVSGYLSSGVISGTLGRNDMIAAPNTTWTFTICPYVSAPCQVVSGIAILSATVNVATVINPQLVPISILSTGAPISAFTNNEISNPKNAPYNSLQPYSGQLWYDTLTGNYNYWNTSAATWSSIGSACSNCVITNPTNNQDIEQPINTFLTLNHINFCLQNGTNCQTVTSNFQQFIAPPVGGQYTIIFPNSHTIASQASVNVVATNSSTQMITNVNNGIDYSGVVNYSSFAYPTGLTQANVTAIYPVVVLSSTQNEGQPLISPLYTIKCNDGTTDHIFVNGGLYSPLETIVATLSPSTQTNISLWNCTVQANGQHGGYTTLNVPTIGLMIYYSGTPLPTNNNLTYINAPVFFNASTNTLGVDAIDLSKSGYGGVINNLPVANLNSGTNASNKTFWRGDGTWATIPSPTNSLIQTVTVTGCATGVGTGDNCTNTITWPTAFASSTSYGVTCTGQAPFTSGSTSDANALDLTGTENQTATTVQTVTTSQGSGQAASFGTITCIGVGN